MQLPRAPCAPVLGRLSGPLLDRVDLRLDVPRVPPATAAGGGRGEPRRRFASVSRRRARASSSGSAGTGSHANAHMGARHLRRLCTLRPEANATLDRAYDRLRLSARACDRVVKVAQTIADLDGAAGISAAHIAESLSYRSRSHCAR